MKDIAQRYFVSTKTVERVLDSYFEELRQSYEVYQELLAAFDAKNPTEFFNLIEEFPSSLNAGFKKVIR